MMRNVRLSAGAALLMAATSCAPIPKSAPPPPPVQAAPRPAPAPQMVVPPRAPWDERDLNQGEWQYDVAARTASYGAGDTRYLVLACTATGSITLTASLGTGDRPQRVDLSTSFGVDALALTSDSMSFAADDLRLDRIAFSRGRFALDASNGSSLTIPVHAEIGRVIEDCRG